MFPLRRSVLLLLSLEKAALLIITTNEVAMLVTFLSCSVTYKDLSLAFFFILFPGNSEIIISHFTIRKWMVSHCPLAKHGLSPTLAWAFPTSPEPLSLPSQELCSSYSGFLLVF